MFQRMGLEMNLKNYKTMVCTPGYIWVKWGEQVYKIQSTGEGATYRERKRLRVSCADCGVTVARSYLKQHMMSLHGICAPQTRGVDDKGEGSTAYVGSFPRILQLVRCPVPGCRARAHSAVRVQEHFMFRHFWS